MKKNIFLVLLFSTVVCYSNVIKLNKEFLNSKDSLRVVKKVSQDFIDGKPEKPEILTFFYEDDKISKIVTASDGKFIGAIEIKYADGKLTEMKEYLKPLKSRNDLYVVRIFNYENELIKSILVTENERAVLKSYTYNNLKQIIECQNLENGKIISEEKYVYHENGNLAKIKYQNGNKDLYKKYDDKNNSYELIYPEAYLKTIRVLKNNIISSFDNKENMNYEYEYNAQNYPVKMIIKRGKKLINITTIEYDNVSI